MMVAASSAAADMEAYLRGKPWGCLAAWSKVPCEVCGTRRRFLCGPCLRLVGAPNREHIGGDDDCGVGYDGRTIFDNDGSGGRESGANAPVPRRRSVAFVPRAVVVWERPELVQEANQLRLEARLDAAQLGWWKDKLRRTHRCAAVL